MDERFRTRLGVGDHDQSRGHRRFAFSLEGRRKAGLPNARAARVAGILVRVSGGLRRVGNLARGHRGGGVGGGLAGIFHLEDPGGDLLGGHRVPPSGGATGIIPPPGVLDPIASSR